MARKKEKIEEDLTDEKLEPKEKEVIQSKIPVLSPAEKLLAKVREKTNFKLKALSDLSDIYNPSDHFDLGNVMLNIMMGGDWKLGAPNNIASMFIGKQDSGKSLMMLMKIKAATDKGYVVYYFETEGAISQIKMKEFGINIELVIPIPMSEYKHLVGLKFYVLDLLDAMNIKDKAYFVFDSIAMVLDSEKFDKNAKGDITKTMGKHAQEMGDFFKAVVNEANLLHKPFDFVNRTHANIKVGDEVANTKYATEEQKEIISGGSAALFGVSAILRIKKEIIYIKITVKDEITGKDKEIKKPIRTKFIVGSARKNRMVKPGMDSYFMIDDVKGLMRYSGLAPYAQASGYLSKVERKGWKLSADDNYYKSTESIPDSSWQFALENGLGEWLNNEFRFAKVYNENGNEIEYDESNLSYDDDNNDELNED